MIVLFVSVTSAVIAIAANSSTLAAFMEEDSLPAEEVIDISPLSQAAEDNDTETLQQLIADGANLEEKDSDGSTALQYAVMMGNLEAAEMLLEHGANVNTKDDWGSTALMNAVFNSSDPEIVQLLLKHGADPSLKDSEGYTAYDYAVENKDAKLRDLLKK